MTDWIKDQNGDFHLDNGSEFVLDPNSRFHLVNTSDFVNDGSEVLKAKSIYSDGGNFTTNGSGDLTTTGGITANGTIQLPGSTGILFDGSMLNYNSETDALTSENNFAVLGATTLDNGKIKTDGNGNLTTDSLNIEKLNISEKTDSSNKSGYVISSTDFNHVDIFGGKLSSTSEFDFSDQNIRSFYTWPNVPTGQFIFGFSSSGLSIDSLVITQPSTTFNNNIIVTGTSSLDNGKITTDGSGNITVSGLTVTDNETIKGTLYVVGATTLNYGASIIGNASISQDITVDGTTSLDNGKIKSDGIGNLTCGAIDSTGESHFYSVTFDDPDSGISRDAKFGDKGIAVHGGIKTDTLTVTSGETISNYGSNANYLTLGSMPSGAYCGLMVNPPSSYAVDLFQVGKGDTMYISVTSTGELVLTSGISITGGVSVNGTAGATGTFTSADGKTITVTSGIITSIS